MIAQSADPRALNPGPVAPKWGFLTNYAVLLAYVVLHPESTIRTIAQGIGVTERAALSILRDLDDDEIVYRHRQGRRNTYTVDFERLGAMRRGGETSALTPRPFVNGIVGMLFELATRHGVGVTGSTAPRQTHEHDLRPRRGTWGFFTNHMLVLLAIARDQTRTVRGIAATAGITERAVVGILKQLEAENIIHRCREGRRTRYTIDYDGFRAFRGWSYSEWSIAPRLVEAAIEAIRGLGEPI